MKSFLVSGIFFLAILALAMDNDEKIVSPLKKYSLTEIVSIKKLLQSNPIPPFAMPLSITPQELARMFFDKNYPCIMFSTVQKKFIPEIGWGRFMEGHRQASPKFDVAAIQGYSIASITNGKGEQVEIPCNNVYRLHFSQSGTELFGDKLSSHHSIIAEKINDQWVAVSPEKSIATNFENKRGYYIRGKEIIFVEDPISEKVGSRDFYVGLIKNNELVFTDEDDQRNYIFGSEGLLSPNKKFLAQRINGFIEVSAIKIAHDSLSLSVIYKVAVWEHYKTSLFALTDEGSLLFYDSNKCQTKGSGELTNEHFFLMMLTRIIGAVRPYSFVLARLAHNIVDKGLVSDEVMRIWADRPHMLKLIILDVLDELNRDARFIKNDMEFVDEDYEFRNSMLPRCTNREEGKKLLQKFALQFYNQSNEYYCKKNINISVDDKTTKLMQKLFPKNILAIIDNYKLFCVHDFIDDFDAQ